MHMHQAIISPTILFSSFFLSFNNGNNNSATSYASSKCGYPDKTNVSIPNDSYSFILSATVCGSPTSQYPPPLTSPIPAHKLGLISNDSLVPLFKCVIRFDQPNHILQISFEQAQLFHYPHIELNVRPLPMLLLLSLLQLRVI